MPYRKEHLAIDEIYHVFTKSIAGYKIFNSHQDYKRIQNTLVFYQMARPPCRFSFYKGPFCNAGLQISEKLVEIAAYCIMPTHIHLVLKQLKENGISKYMNLLLKSYAKHFNLNHNRKGPLWEGRFKNVRVSTDEQLLHLTRYVHLNPVTSFIVNRPEEWKYSSYSEYAQIHPKSKICNFRNYLNISPFQYRKFVKDNIDYQRSLAKIKNVLIESVE